MSNTCRYCDIDSNLINACGTCKGSIGYTCKPCLKKFIKTKVNDYDRCELCLNPYQMSIEWKTPGYLSALKSPPLLKRLSIICLISVICLSMTALLTALLVLYTDYSLWIVIMDCLFITGTLMSGREFYKAVLEGRRAQVEPDIILIEGTVV